MSILAGDATRDLPPVPSVPPGATVAPEVPVAGRGRRLLGELWRDRAAFAGALFLLVVVLAAVFAPLVAPHDPATQSIRDRLVGPVWTEGGSWDHVLGTDNLGRDVLSRLIHGARVSLMVGVAVVALAGVFGTLAGVVAGYKGGRTNSVIMRIVDTQMAFPGLLLALIILATVGPSMTTVIIVLALNNWMIYARVSQGIVLSVKEAPYVEAAELVGCRSRRVIARHILPNLAAPMLTLAVLEFAAMILSEAALSFLGVGIQSPQTSWGLDVAIGKDYIHSAWWLVTFPGLAIALTVLSINVVAGWLRVTVDPSEREKRFATVSIAKTARALRRGAAPAQAVPPVVGTTARGATAAGTAAPGDADG
jgi:peptide/nickel transport system permease protein